MRKAYIDRKVAQFLRDGVPMAKAKRQAAALFDKEHPWFKDGSSRGKQWVSVMRKWLTDTGQSPRGWYSTPGVADDSAAELRAAAAERRLALLSGVKDEVKDEVKEEAETSSVDDSKPDVASHSDSDGSDDDIVEIEDPHLSVEDRRKELEEEMTTEERSYLRGGWEQFVKSESSSSRSRSRSAGAPAALESKTRSTPHTSEAPTSVASDSDDDIVFLGSGPSTSKRKSEPPPPPSAKRATRQCSKTDTPKFGQNVVREEHLRALGLARTTLSTDRTVGSSGSRNGSSKGSDQ